MLTVQTNGATSTALIKFWTPVTVTIHSHLNIHFLFNIPNTSIVYKKGY